MITVREMEEYLFRWAPRELAFDWDNVGHLVGDADMPVNKVLVALDMTEAVVEEAIAIGAELIVTHHPVMNCAWHPVQSVTTDSMQGRILMQMIAHGISGICMHTNLDAADGGVNDALAEKLGLTELEMLNSEKIGRIGTLNYDLPLVEFLPFVVKSLGCNGVRYISCGKRVHRVAVGGGSCGDCIQQAVEAGCDTFVTSDLKYNHFLDTRGINLIDAGHFPTENVICPVIVSRLKREFPALTVVQSAKHQSEVIQYFTKEN